MTVCSSPSLLFYLPKVFKYFFGGISPLSFSSSPIFLRVRIQIFLIWFFCFHPRGGYVCSPVPPLHSVRLPARPSLRIPRHPPWCPRPSSASASSTAICSTPNRTQTFLHKDSLIWDLIAWQICPTHNSPNLGACGFAGSLLINDLAFGLMMPESVSSSAHYQERNWCRPSPGTFGRWGGGFDAQKVRGYFYISPSPEK